MKDVKKIKQTNNKVSKKIIKEPDLPKEINKDTKAKKIK